LKDDIVKILREHDLPLSIKLDKCWKKKKIQNSFSLIFYHQAVGMGNKIMTNACALEQWPALWQLKPQTKHS
jgi:hypothetical protein